MLKILNNGVGTMGQELKDKVANILLNAGIDPQSKGYTYLLDAITLLVEERYTVAKEK